MRTLLALLLAALAAAAQAAGQPKDVTLSIPRAKRTISGHVRAILEQLPEFKDRDRSLEVDELVDAGREIEWGTEGPYWDGVFALAKAASLEVEDTWTQWVKLVPAPSKLYAVRVEGNAVTALRREVDSYSGEPVTATVRLLPPWYEVGGISISEPEPEFDPEAPEPRGAVENLGAGFRFPPHLRRVGMTWESEVYLKTSLEALKCEAGAKVQVAGGSLEMERLAKQRNPDDQTVVYWKTTDLETSTAVLVLEDGTEASSCGGDGRGWNDGAHQGWRNRSVFRDTGSPPRELRVLVIHEMARVKSSRTYLAAELPPPAHRDLLSGSIHWTRRPGDSVVVVTGAVRTDGWGERTARIQLDISGETGALEGTQDNSGWERPVVLEKPAGKDLRYHVFGLDTGEWFVWSQAGNWIELRRVPVPEGAGDGDIVVALNHSASIAVQADGDSATLRPLDDTSQPIPGDAGPGVSLEKNDDGALAADGLKPGDYLLTCGEKERRVKLVEGRNVVNLR